MEYNNLTIPQPYLDAVVGMKRKSFVKTFFKENGTYPTDNDIKNIVLSPNEYEKLKQNYYIKHLSDKTFEDKTFSYSFIDNEGVYNLLTDISYIDSIPEDEIWYVSTDGNSVSPYMGAQNYAYDCVYDMRVVSDTYINGYRRLKLEEPITRLLKGFWENTNKLVLICLPKTLVSTDYNVICNEEHLQYVIVNDLTQACQLYFTMKGFLNNDGNIVKLYLKNKLIEGDLNVPEDVEYISKFFQGYPLIKNVYMGDNVTSLYAGAFHECSNLQSITLSNSLTVLGDACFSFCTNLKNINLPVNLTQIGDQCFWSCSTLSNIELPPNLQSIGSTTFTQCVNLQTIKIPPTVTSIGDNAFSQCYSLTEIEIPSSVHSLKESTFSYCTSLKKVILNNGLTKIGTSCFHNCSKLEEITIPSTVTEIRTGVFNGTSLKDIYMEPLTPPVLIDWYGDTDHKQGTAFDNINEDAKIYVYEDAYEAYINDEKWKKYKNKIVVR